MKTADMLTTAEAARVLGTTVRCVQIMVKDGRLPARRFGKSIALKAADVVRARDRPRPGRPRKDKRTPGNNNSQKR